MVEPDPNFRRASDTRPLPESVPESGKEKRDKWTKESRSIAAAENERLRAASKEIASAQLTREQASQLFDAAEYPDVVKAYKDKIVDRIVELYGEIDPKRKLPFATLLKIAKDICSLERTKYSKTILDQFTMINDIPSKENKDLALFSAVDGISRFLTDGVYQHYREHWVFDKEGNIIGLTPSHINRQPKCNEYIQKNKVIKWQTWELPEEKLGPRVSTSSFPEFLKIQSDPYKGSQQGVGRKHRKTRKHSKKSKKTLRRK